MKIPSDPSQPPARSGDAAAPGSRSFDKVLERKTEDRQSRKARPQKLPGLDPEEDGKNLSAGAAIALPLSREAARSQVAGPAVAPDVQVLEGLVREIVVVAGPGVDPKVELQFHSKTLDGLNVRVVKKGDEISIRFLTGSDSVAQLLSRNSAQLSEALLAKGLHVAPIQVEFARGPAGSTRANDSPRDGRRGQGQERQDKRHR
jgi:hypothetical protein